jgi:hypothetical protein
VKHRDNLTLSFIDFKVILIPIQFNYAQKQLSMLYKVIPQESPPTGTFVPITIMHYLAYATGGFTETLCE